MNVVVLTNNGSIFGRQIILALRHAGTLPSVVAINQPISYNLRLFQRVARRNGVLDTTVQAFHTLQRERMRRRDLACADPQISAPYEKLVRNVQFVPSTNGPATIAAVAALECDLLVLGQCGIVRDELLAVPRIGTLNAHPGILPFYRGIDSCRWAILQGDSQNVGVSVHWVDRGVDTGPILCVSHRQPPLLFRSSDELEDSLFAECAVRLADAVRAVTIDNAPPTVPQDPKAGRQYYKMKRSLIAKVEKLLGAQAKRTKVGDGAAEARNSIAQ
jgi:hypothetical protein